MKKKKVKKLRVWTGFQVLLDEAGWPIAIWMGRRSKHGIWVEIREVSR